MRAVAHAIGVGLWLLGVVSAAACDDGPSPEAPQSTTPRIGGPIPVPSARTGGVGSFDHDAGVSQGSSMPGGCRRPYIQVSAGHDHTCALDQTGCVVCWGRDLGSLGGDTGRTRPERGHYRYVAAGDNHTCAIRTDGRLQCWGDGLSVYSDPGPFALLTADSVATCALYSDGRGICWNTPRAQDVPTAKRFKALAAGEHHVCGLLRDGTVECWASAGEASVTIEGTFKQIAVSGRDTCALRRDGAIECATQADLRFGAPSGEFVQLDLAADRACAVRVDGTVLCWGAGWPASADLRVPEGRFVQVSVGANPSTIGSGHACAIDEAGALHCWGANAFGQATPPER